MQKTAKVDGGYGGGKYIKKIKNFAITTNFVIPTLARDKRSNVADSHSANKLPPTGVRF